MLDGFACKKYFADSGALIAWNGRGGLLRKKNSLRSLKLRESAKVSAPSPIAKFRSMNLATLPKSSCREYLPMLPVRGRFKDKTLKPPPELITLIRKGIEYRNGLVHAGASLPHRKELESILRAVNDVLWVVNSMPAPDGQANTYLQTR